jgi:hypothetical protein
LPFFQSSVIDYYPISVEPYPALSMRGMMIGTARDYGAKNRSDISLTADRLDSSALFLTGNSESIYANHREVQS